MDTITDILARPGEAARQLTEMRAALEASAACVPAARAALEEIKVQFEAVIAERDAARAEVARLTAALHVYERMNNTDLLRGDTAPAGRAKVKSPMDEPTAAVTAKPVKWEDTAPATGTSAWINEIEAEYKCECGHWMVDHDRADDGRRICMRLGCNCLEPAPAGGEARP